MVVTMKQNKFFYLFDSHARDSCGMSDSNSNAVVMKFNDVLELEQHLFCLSTKLHTNLFEIVPVQLNKCEVSPKRTKCVKAQEYQKKRRLRKTQHNKQLRLNKANEYKRRKLSDKTDSKRQVRLERLKQKLSNETEFKTQMRFEKDRVSKKQKRSRKVLLPTQQEINQYEYLSMFGGIEEQGWAQANISKFHKSMEYTVSQCTVCM